MVITERIAKNQVTPVSVLVIRLMIFILVRIVMLKETNQPVTKNSINLILQAHSDQSDDAYLSRIYAVAKDVME
ncbi:hypothetical protein G4E41_004829 [Salmonella enterica]|nr:hypothetical protein [Salmonella enterica]EEI7343923.1 hypothetical protein [Salmonella enterica]